MAINVDYYISRIRSKVTSMAAQVSNVLPGNPLSRDYEVFAQVGSAGPALIWKVYAAQKRSTKKAQFSEMLQPVSVWLFEKKDIDKWPKYEKELFVDILKKGVSQLTKLRHPRILIVEHPLEESRDCFAFCTEPVFASLANALGHLDNIANTAQLKDFELLDLEIQYGLYQMLHRNICPESVIINEKGEWKLSGFEFAIQGVPSGNAKATYEMLEWNQRAMSVVQPSLDYMAPEYVIGGRCDPYADMFSLGVLALTVFNKGKQPFDNQNTLEVFKKNAQNLKTLSTSLLTNVPTVLRDDLKMCLNFTPDLRPDATQFSKILYFDEPFMKTLKSIDSLCQMDNTQKMSFFKHLPQLLSQFPKRTLIQKILPQISAEFMTTELVPFILPSVFQIVEAASSEEFGAAVLPHLVSVFRLERPYQIPLLFLQNMDVLLQKANENDSRKYLLPLICGALSSDTYKIQELCISTVPKVVKLIERQCMKTEVLPKLLRLSVDATGMLAIRVQALMCIGKLMPNIEAWMVSEQIIPAISKVNSREPAILMAALGIYKLAFDDNRFGISREQCAKNVLPFLIASSMENTLNVQQFEQYMTLTHRILEKIEKEQRQRLQQLSASQEEQRSIGEFAEVLNPKTDLCNASNSDNLGSFNLTVSATDSRQSNSKLMNGPLSLADKKRLAAEQEQNLRMRNQPEMLRPNFMKQNERTDVECSNSNDFTFDSMLEAAFISTMTPAPSTTSTNIDLSEFLPKLSLENKEHGTLNMQPTANIPTNINCPTWNPVNLPSPPSASNPINRTVPNSMFATTNYNFSTQNKSNMSSLNDIVCFPNKTNQPTMMMSSVKNASETDKKARNVNIDPFADLFS